MTFQFCIELVKNSNTLCNKVLGRRVHESINFSVDGIGIEIDVM